MSTLRFFFCMFVIAILSAAAHVRMNRIEAQQTYLQKQILNLEGREIR